MAESNINTEKIAKVYESLSKMGKSQCDSIKFLFDRLHDEYMFLLRHGKEEYVPIYRRLLSVVENMEKHILQPEIQLAKMVKQKRRNSSFLYRFYDSSSKEIDELDVLDNLIMKVSRKEKNNGKAEQR